MQIHITPRNLTLTGAIHEFVAEKVSHLEGHGETILGAHIVLLHNHDRKKPFHVKVHLALPADLYTAIDKVVDKLSRQISKLKTKHKELKKHRTQQEREAEKRGYKRR